MINYQCLELRWISNIIVIVLFFLSWRFTCSFVFVVVMFILHLITGRILLHNTVSNKFCINVEHIIYCIMVLCKYILLQSCGQTKLPYHTSIHYYFCPIRHKGTTYQVNAFCLRKLGNEILGKHKNNNIVILRSNWCHGTCENVLSI